MKIINELNGKEIGAIRKNQRPSVAKDAEKSGKESAAKASGSSEAERISFSEESKEVERLKQAIGDLPDVRHEKVEAIKGKLASGDYEVPMDKVAEKIVADIV